MVFLHRTKEGNEPMTVSSEGLSAERSSLRKQAKTLGGWLSEPNEKSELEDWNSLLLRVEDAETILQQQQDEFDKKMNLVDMQFETRTKTLAKMMSEELIRKQQVEVKQKLQLIQALSFTRKPEQMQLIYHEDGKEETLIAHVAIIPRTHANQILRLINEDEWKKLEELLKP